jgi:outer membrane protein OmpA-like peptidoglycan-associated protein
MMNIMLRGRRRIEGVLALALLALLFVSPVMAMDIEDGDWELGAYVGQSFMDTYGRDGMSDLAPDDDFFVGVRMSYWHSPWWSYEGSFQLIETPTSVSGVNLDMQSLRFNLLYHMRNTKKIRPFLTAGVGWDNYHAEGVIDGDGVSANVGVGFRWQLLQNSGLRFDVRMAATDVDAPVDGLQSNLETTLGWYMVFGGPKVPDEDEDHVRDSRDRCPGTPHGAIVDVPGCPLDGDNDGVFDGIDACPDTPAGYTVDGTGCALDSDGDGVNDALDKCPDTPEGATVNAEGCPSDADSDGVFDGIDTCSDTPSGATVDEVGCPSDSDDDGVFDGIDNCPDTPKDVEIDRFGCPVDSDGDRVFNGIDQCPNTPAGVEVDERGCVVLFVAERDELVLEGVAFEFNSADLTADAMVALDRVVLGLADWSDVNVEIGGHSDAIGVDAYNLTLSEKRAAAVMQYLVDQGVDATRMEAKGYGETEPIVDNDTEEGRNQNRRVVLKKL